MGRPLRIGQTPYEHGLGTHANSDILVRLPPRAKAFKALIGVDTDDNPAGSVQFSVEAGGKELFRSEVCKSGEKAVAVEVAIPAGATELNLKTDTTPDGPACDHADWAEARLVLADGNTLWLDAMKLLDAPEGPLLPGRKPPFSFIYDGRASEAFLPNWNREEKGGPEDGGRGSRIVSWADTQTGLKVTATIVTFKDLPAAEWVLRFENTGTADTPILENVQALDGLLHSRPPAQELILRQINGSDASERDFVPSQRMVAAGQACNFAPVGGRSSNGTFPYFNVQFGDKGLIVAIGWSGQWAAQLQRQAEGPTRITAGMQRTRLRLHPGESIRTPSILLLSWQGGDWIDAQNQFRRLLLAHYIPRLDGKPVQCCIGAQTFNRWAGGARPQWGTEAGQIASARINQELGCDTLWLDAGWFTGNFPNGVGNWDVKPGEFPRGLRPIADECHRLGLRWLIWWEPERVAAGTRIAREHPEFVLGGAKGGLFNLADPKARRWMTDLLNRQIDEFGVDCYRNDFNTDPLAYWRDADSADRQGITEIRYIEGLYEMWDEIRAKHRNIWFDDCASGGRRIDIEMLRRAVVQTRSDAACAPGRADWDQSQTYGLSLWVPCHATIGWELDTYSVRSTATGGYLGEWDILDPQFAKQQAAAAIAEVKENQQYWYGDYYPLTPWSLSPEHWMAYQLHRPDLDAGIVLAFRRQQSQYSAIQVKLRGINPKQVYQVVFSDDERRKTMKRMSGDELATMELSLAKPRSSLLVRYVAVQTK